ncbi:23485_t:CDS:2 [Gigaspora margarita]|uniref:23485_t:CDS:1 n=1 Tax=Gigaspora margarita TaxID=4874 RepID=A0ABN7V2M0_GIGMA|nr:23485_t:CDS:2 [Gigaspora margarita]
MAAPPIKFYRDMDPTSEKYLVNLKVCEKLFQQVSDANYLFKFYGQFSDIIRDYEKIGEKLLKDYD